MKTHFLCLVALGLLLLPSTINAQFFTDFSVGTSNQDNFFISLSANKQLKPRLCLGLEYQFGSPEKRFIEAQKIDEGYANTFSIPLIWTMNKTDQIGLHLFIRPGLRLQGVIDPDDNDVRDSILNSTALLFEAGLLVNVPIGEKAQFQSGITFPTLFEINPSTLFENNSTLVHAGWSYRNGDKSVLFAKSYMGPSFGASGDTQKFSWSIQAGMRFNLGSVTNEEALLIAPSF